MDKRKFGNGGTKVNVTCEVILDLIPLVKDGVASEQSSMLVDQHIKDCQDCQGEYESVEMEGVGDIVVKDQKIILAIKRSVFITQLAILVVGAVIGVALSNSMGMFYNFIIMPIVGGVSLLAFRRRCFWVPIAVFILSYVWTTIMNIVEAGFKWIMLYSGLFYSVIYSGLVVLGIVIAGLLWFAFKKEDE